MKKQRIGEAQLNMIKNAQNIAIFAHKNPDWDAYGSSLAMRKILENMWKNAKVFLPDVSDVYSFLPDYEKISTTFDYSDERDLLIILDSSTFDRIDKNYFENPDYFLEKYPEKTLIIDHHISWNNPFTIQKENILQYHWYSSTCELIFDLFYSDLKKYFDSEIATYLFLGVYTDTWGFKYGEHPENSFNVAGELMKLWADKNKIIYDYVQARGLNEVKFAAYLIDRVQKYNTILYSFYAQEDLDTFEIDSERASLWLNILQTVKWDWILLVVRYIDWVLKFSMRSRGDLSVGAIADAMWGGGHKNAAGFAVKIWDVKNYHEEIKKILEKIS